MGTTGGLVDYRGKFAGSWRTIIKIKKDFSKLNLSLESWFQNPDENDPNKWPWALHNSGSFSVGSARFAFDSRYLSSSGNRSFRWNSWLPSKVNILAWRVLNNRLPTKLNLQKRGVVCLSLLCPLCELVEEDETHLFFGCSTSRQLLKDLCLWWEIGLEGISSFQDFVAWCDTTSLNQSQKRRFLEWSSRTSGLFGRCVTVSFFLTLEWGGAASRPGSFKLLRSSGLKIGRLLVIWPIGGMIGVLPLWFVFSPCCFLASR